MICQKCGTTNPDTAKFCQKCGNALSVPTSANTGYTAAPGYNPAPGSAQGYGAPSGYNTASGYNSAFGQPSAAPSIPAGLSKKAYFNSYLSAQSKKSIRSAAILGYVCIGISFVLAAIMLNIVGIAFIAIMLALVFGFHIGKNKPCAIVLTVLAVIDSLMALILTGQFSGYLMIICGISAIIATNAADKEYKSYLQSQNAGYNPYYTPIN